MATKVIKAHGGRFGPGKVHYPMNSAYEAETLCGRTVYGVAVSIKDNPVTCKVCLSVTAESFNKRG